MDTKPSRSPAIRSRWLILAAGLLAFVVAAGSFLLSPAILETIVTDALTTDAQQEVRIAGVRFNPLTGRGSVRELSITTPQGAEMSIGLAQFDLDLLDLWQRRAHFVELRVENARLNVERTASGWVLGGFGPLETMRAAPAESGWRVGIDRLEIRKALVRYEHAAVSQQVDIEMLDVSDAVPWQPLTPSAFELKAAMGEARISAKGTATPFARTPRVTTDVRLASLRLDSVTPFLSPESPAAPGGTASAELRVDARRAGDGGIEARVSGSSALDGLDAALADTSVGLKHARWAGDIKITAAAPGTTGHAQGEPGASAKKNEAADISPLRLQIGGTVTAESASLERPSQRGRQRLSTESMTVDDLQGGLDIGPAGRIRGAFNVDLRAKTLRGGDSDVTWDNELVEWKGKIAHLDEGDGRSNTSYEGRALATGLKLDWEAAELSLRQESGAWEGRLVAARPGGGEPIMLTMEAGTHAAGLWLDSKRLRQRVLDLGTLELKGARIGHDAVLQVDEASVLDLGAFRPLGEPADETGRPPRPAFALKKLLVERVEMPTPARINAARVTLDGSTSRLVRDAKGRLELIDPVLTLAKQFESDQANEAGQGGKGAGAASGMTFSVGEVVIAGGSRVVFEDRSVEPTLRLAATSFSARIERIDSAEPGQDSPFSLDAKFGSYGQMDVKGTLRPFADRLTLDAVGALKSFDLPVISPYVSRNLGYSLTRGRLDADIRVNLVEGRLQAGSALVLSKLQVAITDSEEARPLRETLDVPVEKALSLLRDSDDVIRLSIPVSGDIDNPRFDFSDAINQAVGNAIRDTMLTTLKFAIPIVGIISILNEAGDAKVQFKPVGFEPGSAALDPASVAYLGELARLLAQRPAMTLSVCGRATEADRDALSKRAAAQPSSGAPPSPGAPQAVAEVAAEQLLRLANRRGRVVKERLVETHGVPHERVFNCLAEIDAKSGAVPRAEILM